MFLQLWTSHANSFMYIAWQEWRYISSMNSIRHLGGAVTILLLFDTILIAAYVAMIAVKVIFLSRDPLYRLIYGRLARGQRIQYRRTNYNRWTQRGPHKELLAILSSLVIISVILSVLGYELRLLKHTLQLIF